MKGKLLSYIKKMVEYFPLIVKIVCLFGCVYQSMRISELYFSYETITNVKYEDEPWIELSGLTICYPKISQVTN